MRLGSELGGEGCPRSSSDVDECGDFTSINLVEGLFTSGRSWPSLDEEENHVFCTPNV